MFIRWIKEQNKTQKTNELLDRNSFMSVCLSAYVSGAWRTLPPPIIKPLPFVSSFIITHIHKS